MSLSMAIFGLKTAICQFTSSRMTGNKLAISTEAIGKKSNKGHFPKSIELFDIFLTLIQNRDIVHPFPYIHLCSTSDVNMQNGRKS